MDNCGGRFPGLLDAPVSADATPALRTAETIGSPGDRVFQDAFSRCLGRVTTPGRGDAGRGQVPRG